MKALFASKTVWLAIAQGLINILGVVSGQLASHPTAAMIVNGALALLTIWARSVAQGPLSLTGK